MKKKDRTNVFIFMYPCLTCTT